MSRPFSPRSVRRRFVVLACALGALVVSGAGYAHGYVVPSPAPVGKTRLVISVPNESVNVPITGFRLQAPANVLIERVEGDDGFTATIDGSRVEWSGGSVGGGSTARFELTVILPADTSHVVFEGEEIYGTLESGAFPLAVPISASATPLVDGDGSGDGAGSATGVWVVGGVIAATAVGTVAFIAMSRRRARRRPCELFEDRPPD